MITATPGQNDYSDFVSNNLNENIYFSKGIWPFKKPINIIGADKISIFGDGMGLTALTGFKLNIETNEDWNNLFLTLKDIKIVDCEMNLSDCCYMLFENIFFSNSKITMKGCWDSVFRNLHMVKSAGILIDERIGKYASSKNGSFSNCLTFDGGRFESCVGVPLTIKHSRKINLNGVKFHGVLPTPLALDHLVLDTVVSSVVTNCNFTVCGKSYVNLKNCNRINFNNIMDNPYEYAFDVTNSDRIVIDGIIQAKKLTNATKGVIIKI